MFSGVRLEDYSALVLRPFLRGKVSRKRINQDFFESLCDVSIRQLSDIKAVLTNDVKSVYVRSDLLDEQLLHSLPKTVETLISGNSDRDFTEPIEIPSFIRRVFLQNLSFDSQNVDVLPIGVENLALAKNGLPHLFSTSDQTRLNRALVGPFGLTHADRKELLEAVSGREQNVYKVERRMTAWEYSRVSRRYQFVACPRGNGIDTHRFWETLYRGGIPVVRKSNWSIHVARLGLPLVQLNSWAELPNLDFNALAAQFSDNPRVALRPEYWFAEIGG